MIISLTKFKWNIIVPFSTVIIKLRSVGPRGQERSQSKRKSHRKVTKLVLTVITVYIICWLPHWVTQIALIRSVLSPHESDVSSVPSHVLGNNLKAEIRREFKTVPAAARLRYYFQQTSRSRPGQHPRHRHPPVRLPPVQQLSHQPRAVRLPVWQLQEEFPQGVSLRQEGGDRTRSQPGLQRHHQVSHTLRVNKAERSSDAIVENQMFMWCKRFWHICTLH